MLSFFIWLQVVPPPPPPGGSELWSGTTDFNTDGDSISNGDWIKEDLEAALQGTPLPGGWVGYFGIMNALESGSIDRFSLRKREWRVLVNYARDNFSDDSEQRRVCDLAESSLGELPNRCNNLPELPISKNLNILLILSFLMLFLAYPYRDRFFLFK